VDATDGSLANLGGNYGVLYRLHLEAQASDGRKLALLFNPRGGAWGNAVSLAPGLSAGGVILVPAGTGTLADSTQAVIGATYAPGAGEPVWLQFMPAGGSSFPVELVAVPF